LISISTDGVLCEWSLSNLSRPINKYDLSVYKNDEKYDNLNEIGPLCIGTCYNKNLNEFIIGCDRNDIYKVRLYDNDYDIINSFTGSKGPTFCISSHPLYGDNNPDFSDLFLSCGADWSTKLWSTNIPDIPLISFNQSKDYVYSAKWHPINPFIFATGDGSGFIDLWDLNRDKEIPTFRYNLKNAINKLAWSFDGKKLAAGDINGHINIFSSEKDVINVKNEDVNKFFNSIENIKENRMKKLEKLRKKKESSE
jgi:dynein intermediate chain